MKILKKLNIFLDRGQKIKIVGLMVLILIGGLMETLGVTIILPLLNAITSPEEFGANVLVQKSMRLLGMEDLNRFILVLILIVALIFVFKNLYLVFQYYIQSLFINNNRYRTSTKLLALYLNRPYEFFLNTDTPTILRTIYGDMDNVFNLLFQCMNLATEIVVAICVSAVILAIDVKMTFLIVGLLGLVTLFITLVIKRKLNQVGNGAREEQALLYKWILQSATGIKDVKVRQKERFFVANYKNAAKKYAAYQTSNTVLISLPRLLIETVAIIGILLYIAINILVNKDPKGMIGLIGAFGVAALRLLPSINRINTYMANIAYYEPALNYIYDNVNMKELREIPEILKQKEADSQKQTLTMKKEILLQDIVFSYPDTDVRIFEHADMRIPVGKSVGVMGSSGAGKTTIVDILLGLLQTKQGTITSDGINIFENRSAWLAHIGYIPQSIYMMDDTIRNNIAFGVEPDEIDDGRVWEVLEEAQLKEYVEGLADGLDSEIGERGIRISGGQRQRLGIARALYHNPELLIFDEATSALDTDTETAIMEAVEKLHGRKTMVIIAHRLRTIESCDVIYEVKDGKIKVKEQR